MTNNEIFEKMKLLGIEIAKAESLPLKSIERINKLKGNLGLCHPDGKIEIYIIPSSSMIERVKIQESTRTICHELAHLKHFNHDEEFWKYQKVLCKIASSKLGLFIPAEKGIPR